MPVEILNFATTAYATIENVYVCERVIPEFQPDAMFLVAHGAEVLRCSRKLAKQMIDPEVELTYDWFKDLQRRARIDSRNDGPRPDFLTTGQNHSFGLSILDEDAVDRCLRANLRPETPGRRCDSQRDLTGPASGESPRPKCSVNLAHVVMQQYVGGPR